ncbi:unnamed protein product, partial [Didymodactylos carnosus]
TVSNLQEKDPYKWSDVTANATQDEIRADYKRRA